MMPFTPENVAAIENKSGNYYFYNSKGTMIYVGISIKLRHRIQSYYQKDDLKVHRTKKQLRKVIAFFKVVYRSIDRAREIELMIKKRTRFNFK